MQNHSAPTSPLTDHPVVPIRQPGLSLADRNQWDANQPDTAARMKRFEDLMRWSWEETRAATPAYFQRLQFAVAHASGRVLEIGCGIGAMTRWLSGSEMVSHVVAVDAFPEAISKLAGYALPKITPIQAALDQLVFEKDERFDTVVICEVIEHIYPGEEASFLRGLRDHVHEGTKFIVSTPIGWMKDPHHTRGFTEHEFLRHLEIHYGSVRQLDYTAGYSQIAVGVFRPDEIADSPRVSVILPTYNHLAFLPQSIASVLAQTFEDFELVIVNDGSTDGTREYLYSLADTRVRVIHQANQRLPKALNAGFMAAQGGLLTWTSADNYCAPIFLEALVAALDAHPEAGIACGAFASINEADQITGVQNAPDMTFRNVIRGNPGNAAFLYRRACQDVVGTYAVDLEGAEDWDMWLRIVERFPSVRVEEILYYYRRHGDSMTAKKQAQIKAACGLVFQRALERMGGLDFDRLYPTLARCQDRPAAEAVALHDLGTWFLRSAVVPPELAARLLADAFARRPCDEVLANLSLAYARCGQWTEVGQCLGQLVDSSRPEFKPVVEALRIWSAAGVAPGVKQICPLAVSTNGVEVFELEAGSKLTFSLTCQTTVTSSVPTAISTAHTPQPTVNTAVSPASTEDDVMAAVERNVREALAIDPNGVDALKLLAQLCLRRGQWLEASRACLRVAEIAPRDVVSLLVLAKCFFEMRDQESVRLVLEKVLEIEPENQIARDNLAQLAQATARPEESADRLQQMLVRGQALLEKGDIAGARRELEQAATLAPHDADLQVCVGNLQAEQGDIDAARASYSRALRADANHSSARERLVDLTINGGAAAGMSANPAVASAPAPAPVSPTEAKGEHELAYWRKQKDREGTLSNTHYEQYYTTHFGFGRDFFKGKRILDIGCGPRGSLEWADMAAERVGLDPLADSYLKLGADQHKMRYVAAPSEAIPFPDGHFDVVMSFNSLDHVEDLDRTIAEIMRVVKPGGHFLLLTDVNHSPTPCEPIEFSWDVVGRFAAAFDLVEQRQFEKPAGGGLYKGVTEAVPYDHGKPGKRYGILSAKFRKRVSVPALLAETSPESPDANERAFAHLQRGFDLLKDRRFAEAQKACREYQRLVRYDDLPRTDNRTESHPKVSVVIVAYKINQGLIQCLDSLAASANPPHEIIVVDNGGNESIHAELACRPILHIRVGFNVILAEGRNIGVHFARAPYALFIDDDAIAAGNYIGSVLEAFETFDVHAFRGKVLPKTDHPHNSRARHYNLGDLPFPADIDTEGNSAFRIDTWRKLGGQDPLLFGGEGVDLSCRISKIHGDLVLMYWPFMVIQHDYAVTDNKLETKSSRHGLMREYSVFKQPDLYTFHNKLVAFARSPETKAEGHGLLPRHAQHGPSASGASPAAKVGEQFFSICVPTYNRAEFIAQTLASAFNQTHQNFELVVVDDGSTDDTAKVMQRVTDPRVRYIVKEHSGGPETRNRCIAEARGVFLVWLDSDDLLLPDTLARYAAALREHPQVDVLYGNLQVADDQLNVVERWVYGDYHGWGATLLGDTVIENRIPNVCTLVRKSCYARVGGYNPAFPRAHDYEFWTRLTPVALFKSVNADVGIYRRHEQSLSKVRQQVNTSYEAKAVQAMVERHSLRALFPSCYSIGTPTAHGEARAWLIAALVMMKYGELASAVEFAARSAGCAELGLNTRISGLLQVVSGRTRSLPGAKAADEFGRLVEQAARLFASGQVQPCAQACAKLTELRPDAAETLLLVGLSLRRWANPHDAKTAFRCLVQRQCERAHLETIIEAEEARRTSAVNGHALAKFLAPVFRETSIPDEAIVDALAFIARAASAVAPREFLSAHPANQTPLFFAILSLAPDELEQLVDREVAGQIARLRTALQPATTVEPRKPGYSFCIITGGQRREKLARQIASIHALNLPAYEILVGGEVSHVPPGVRKVALADAARAGRLGKMRNELGRHAEYDHLVVCDDDLVFDPGFAEGLKRFGEGYDALAVRIVNPDGSRFWDWATTGGTRGSGLLDYWDADPNAYITGGICVLKTEVLERVQWDDSRGFYESEDVDFSTRLKAAGFTIRYNVFAAVLHDDDRYSRVERRIYQFDHLREAISQAHQSGELGEVRRLFPHAVRIAGNYADRKQALQALVRRMNLPELLAEPTGIKPIMPSATGPISATSGNNGKLELNWQGSFLDYGSLSNINRVLTDTLVIQNGASIRRLQTAAVNGKLAKPLQSYRGKLAASANPNAALTVRHAWPPDWSRPACGKLAVIQPWEFGSLPKDWVKSAANVDAFWVPSNYVRQVYLDSGVPAEKVHVLPNGIDPKVFTPDAKPLKLATKKSFKFLFVGGTIYRKGPDVLLKAYVETFTAKDDVCLVIKDFGGGSVYAGQTLEQQIREIQKHATAPEILYLNQDLPPHELPGLYTACDCLAHPYRGEGFGLPVLEAMACGLPVIVTAGGATDDFVPDEAGYKIPAKRQVFGREISGMPLVGDGWLLEPDAEAMKWVLRRAFANRDEARSKGQFAREHARHNWTWNHTAHRLADLARECVAAQRAVGNLPALPVTTGKRKPAQPLKITLPPVAKLGHLGAARELLRQHKFVPAWNATLEALAIRPFHPEAYLLLAKIAGQAGDQRLMKECVDRARAFAPNWKSVKEFTKNHSARKSAGKVELPPLPAHVDPRLSVCLIAKNEEKFLGQCLRSIKGIASQIVVMDTGSSDRTVAIAQEHGAEVHHFTWGDDFSAARNVALEKATGDWVLVLDADEELSREGIADLKQALNAANTISWRLPIVDAGKEAEGCTYVPRLFRNAPGFFYVSRVHEQVFSSVEVRREEWGMATGVGTAKLIHHGYTAEVLRDRNKIARNLRLLELAIEEIPGDPNLLMNYGLELFRSERPAEGLLRYAEAFAALATKPANEVTPELRETLLTQYSSQLMKLSRWSEISIVLTSPLAQRGGLTASLHFTLGLAHQELRQWAEAITQFRECLRTRGQSSFYLVNPLVLGGAPRHCLALALWRAGELDAAAREFAAALAEDPALAPLRMDAARFMSEHGDAVEAIKLLHGLVTENSAFVAAWVLGARVALSHPDFIEFARDWTTEAVSHHPGNADLIAARGETLLLTQQFADALPWWQQLDQAPRALSARVLCELMQGELSVDEPPGNEAEISRDFLTWYRRLIRFGAGAGVEAIGERLELLSLVLPSAGRTLRQILEQAAVETA